MEPTTATELSDVEPFAVVMVGGGNMGAALLAGMLAAGVVTADEVSVAEVVGERRRQLVEQFPDVDVRADIAPNAAAIVAVKPHHVEAAVRSAVSAGAQRIVSIAAGVRLSTLEDAAGPGVAVCRAMPNTPALVGAGYAGVAAGTSAAPADVDFARRVLGAVGIVDEVAESMLDAVTGVAGSGPAYVFLIAEALIDAAVREGIARPIAERMVTQLLTGSAALLAQQGNPAQLRANVTSPGGTTADGLAALETHGLRAALAAAVHSATRRSRELG